MRHFEEQLDDLRKRLLAMSGLVESAIYRSILALIEKDEDQANLVLQNESRINQMEIEIDEQATRLLALDQPVAADLRFITATIKINSNLAERALSLMHEPVLNTVIDIPHMANLVESMVRKALDAFVQKDAELARSVLLSDDAVDEMRDLIYRKLVSYMQQDPRSVPQGIDFIFVARNLERVADHATNIAEDVVFLVEGVDVRHHAEVRR
jgi:phosphate transport system protein